MYFCFFSSSSSESESDESDEEVKVDKFGNTIDYVPLENDNDSYSETETDQEEICDIDTAAKHSYSTNSCDNREEGRNETKVLAALSKTVITANKTGDNEIADESSNTETVGRDTTLKDEQEEQLR